MNVHRRIAHGFKGLDTAFFKIIPFIFYIFLGKILAHNFGVYKAVHQFVHVAEVEL
jgi:hypothetical protein